MLCTLDADNFIFSYIHDWVKPLCVDLGKTQCVFQRRKTKQKMKCSKVKANLLRGMMQLWNLTELKLTGGWERSQQVSLGLLSLLKPIVRPRNPTVDFFLNLLLNQSSKDETGNMIGGSGKKSKEDIW